MCEINSIAYLNVYTLLCAMYFSIAIAVCLSIIGFNYAISSFFFKKKGGILALFLHMHSHGFSIEFL